MCLCEREERRWLRGGEVGGGVCKLFYFLEFVRIRSKDFLPTLRMIRNNKYIKITYSIISKNPLLVKMGNFYIIVAQN